MSAEDMATRAQFLRTHAYAMASVRIWKHAVPPAPVITSVVFGSLIAWRGSAGAVKYSVERLDAASGKWQLICDQCATDADDPWPDPHPGGFLGAKYRVTAYNADGTPSAPSQPY